MAKAICKKCKAECCTCTGCNPKTYVNGLCPLCQKLENANSENKPVQGLQQSEGTIEAIGLFPPELLT